MMRSTTSNASMMLCVYLLSAATLEFSNAFTNSSPRSNRMRLSRKNDESTLKQVLLAEYQSHHVLFNTKQENDDDARGESGDVQVGTKEYYAGFVSRGVNDEVDERVSGDKVLVPTLKLVGGSFFVLGLLFVGFMVSNGLL